MTKFTVIQYVCVQACLSEHNFPSYSLLNTILKVKLQPYKSSKGQQAQRYQSAVSKLLTLTLKACTVLSRRRMLQTTSVCCLSRASSDARTLQVLPAGNRKRAVITVHTGSLGKKNRELKKIKKCKCKNVILKGNVNTQQVYCEKLHYRQRKNKY